ncbi:TolC family protein [Hydrogenimonas sp.]|uniref:TolC family protein n=1 Tax=Hydrogenimonas sp. TaxID=2231112 RepID=UPI002615D4B8|nr:TolC family protein [Hydrogenimonas sp.]
MKKSLFFSMMAALVTFTGCTKLGPDFSGLTAPPLPKEIPADRNVSDDTVTEWWRIFDDPVLDRLVEKARKQNLDLESAGLRILQARAALGISTGMRYPQKQTLSGGYMSTYQDRQIDSYALNFDMGWELDLWGKYARGIESSEASLYAAVASYDALTVSLLAEVARNYIAYRTTEERIAYAKRNIAIQERVAHMTEIQFNSGNVSELDMQQARTQLYNTRAALPALELSKIKSVNALATLLAVTPEEIRAMIDTHDYRRRDEINRFIATGKKGTIQLVENEEALLDLSYVPDAAFDPHAVIDASLLMRRPDIKAAEYRARAASAQIGATEALLYPSFALVGNLGYNATDIGLGIGTAAKNLSVTAGPGFSWNIFQYDRIKNQVRIQDAKFQESLVNYSKQVLQAASEVSNALNGYVLTQAQLAERKKALEATVRAFNISVTQYHDGLVSYQRLLSTVEKLTTTQDIYAQMRGALATDIVLLYKALGGGWQSGRGGSCLSEKTVESLKMRGVDWGNYLDENMTKLPEKY